MSKGYMYILKCCDNSYYTGSTKDLELRFEQHQTGFGANYTKKRLPVELVYFEEFDRIDDAFFREKQIQGWSRKKKEALIKNETKKLHELAKCKNESSCFDFAQQPNFDFAQQPNFDFAQQPNFDFAQQPSSSLSEVETKSLPKNTKITKHNQSKVAECSRIKVAERSRSKKR